VSGGGQRGGDAAADQAERGGGDQAGVDEVVSGGLVAAAAAVEEQVGLGAQLELRPPAATARRIARSRPLRVVVVVMAVSVVRGGSVVA
jgi:hypothetical protein